MPVFFKLFYLEFSKKLVGLLVWILAWTSLGALFASVFNNYARENEDVSKLLKVSPQSLLKAFNISDSFFNTPEKFLSGQFLTFYLLISSVFAIFLGLSLVSSKIANKTIFNFLNIKITRSSFLLNQILISLVYLFLCNFLVILGLKIDFWLFGEQRNLDNQYLFYLFLGSFLLQNFFTSLTLLLGMMLKNSTVLSVAITVSVATWFVNSLVRIGGVPDILKFLSPFYYFDTAKLSKDFSQDLSQLLILVPLILFFYVTSLILWRFKDVGV